MRHYPTSCLFFSFSFFLLFLKKIFPLWYFFLFIWFFVSVCPLHLTVAHIPGSYYLAACAPLAHTLGIYGLSFTPAHPHYGLIRSIDFLVLWRTSFSIRFFFNFFFSVFSFTATFFYFLWIWLFVPIDLTVSQDDLLRDILPPIRYDSGYKFLFKHSLATPNKSWCCSAEILSLLYVLLWPGDDLEPRCLISGDFSPSTICQWFRPNPAVHLAQLIFYAICFMVWNVLCPDGWLSRPKRYSMLLLQPGLWKCHLYHSGG